MFNLWCSIMKCQEYMLSSQNSTQKSGYWFSSEVSGFIEILEKWKKFKLENLQNKVSFINFQMQKFSEIWYLWSLNNTKFKLKNLAKPNGRVQKIKFFNKIFKLKIALWRRSAAENLRKFVEVKNPPLRRCISISASNPA